MRFISKYNHFLNESTENNDVVVSIVETMLDFIDEGEKITFKSSTGDMSYSDYLEKNDNYQKFKPVITARGTTTSRFTIVYRPKDGSYKNLMIIIDNMQSTIDRLGDDGWVLSEFRVGTNKKELGSEVSISGVSFDFSKPLVKNDADDVELPDEDELRQSIESFGIGINRLSIGDHETELEFFSYSYDGSLNSEDFYDDAFEKICDIFGFSSYHLEYQRATVYFEH